MRRLFSWLTRSKSPAPAGLDRAEVDLLTMLRLAPQDALSGKDLVLAQALVSRGLLRAAGGRRFVLTEKALVEFRARR